MRIPLTSLLASHSRRMVICLICFLPNFSTAQHIQVALSNALEDIDNALTGLVYPDFASMGNLGVVQYNDILAGEATNAIPLSMLNSAYATQCYWTDVVSGGITTRTSYLAVNCSGLLDANYIGGMPRIASINVNELDISALPDIIDTNNFYSDRTSQGPYQSIHDLAVSNSGVVNPVSNLFIYSYDPDRDRYFINVAELGQTNATLLKKFNINSITNFASFYAPPTDLARYQNDASFMNSYFNPLVVLITESQGAFVWKPQDIAWNIVNWLDTDRIPQTGDIGLDPWNHTDGGEALPLINEIILSGSPGSYQFTVELWFPFAGGTNITVEPGDFTMEIITSANGTETFPVPFMKYGTASEFTLFTNSPFATLPVTFRTAVFYQGTKVDQAMDRDNMTTWTTAKAMSVDDPRANGKRGMNEASGFWKTMPATPGAINVNCNPWMTGPNGQRQGLPIYAKDGLMEKVGELGYIFLSNRENQVPNPGIEKHFWSTISLYEGDEGALLMDRITTRDINAPPEAYGLININSQHPEVLKVLFKSMKVGPLGGEYTIPDAAIDNLVDTIMADTSANGPYIRFEDMFTSAWDGGPVGQAFRACAAGAPGVSDTHYEDVLRNITEMVTFRQNLFTIILAVQANDWSEERAMATVSRDSYTGTFITNSLNWLSAQINGVPVGWLSGYYPNTNDLYSATWNDTDGDGLRAWEEYISGTDPTNATSIFKITDISQITTNDQIIWNTVAGKNYTVQTTTNLMSAWTNVSDPMYTNIVGSGVSLSYTNTDAEGPHRFFRVKVR